MSESPSSAFLVREDDWELNHVFRDYDVAGDSDASGRILQPVATSSLRQVLNQFGAPKIIDYLSIDVEGADFGIIDNLPLDEFVFRFVSVEHNYLQNDKIDHVMNQYGYVRTNEELSLWDGFYRLD